MKKQLWMLPVAAACALTLLPQRALADAPEQQTKTAPAGAESSVQEPLPEWNAAGPDLETDPEQPSDAAGELRFENVERRVREGNLTVKMFEETIASIECIDYDKMESDLRSAIGQMARAEWAMLMFDPLSMLTESGTGQLDSLPELSAGSILGGINGYLDYRMGISSAASALETQQEALRKQLEDLKDGKLQEDSADAVRQLRNAQDQLVLTMETMYITAVSLDTQGTALERQLAALDRQTEEITLRNELGQVSNLTLEQIRAARNSLASGLQTLRNGIHALQLQLELQTGTERQDALLTLGPLPEVSGAELDAMDPEADLEAAKAVSYELYDASLTLDKAKQAWMDGAGYLYADGVMPDNYKYESAHHTYLAAQYSYENTVRSYEVKFETLYEKVLDKQQVLEAARVSLKSQQDTCAAEALKYKRGMISLFALLTAEDELRTAEEAVKKAADELFAAYNEYCWAVERGIINSQQ